MARRKRSRPSREVENEDGGSEQENVQMTRRESSRLRRNPSSGSSRERYQEDEEEEDSPVPLRGRSRVSIEKRAKSRSPDHLTCDRQL